MVDKQHIKGALDKAKGAIKDAVGGATGDRKMQLEGKAGKAKGAVRGVIGDIKETLRKRR